MDDKTALLNAIIAAPDEDVPRLAYADAIQEDEPERAEFIRVQCEIERLATTDECGRCHNTPAGEPTDGECYCTPAFLALCKRERELLNSDAWPFSLNAAEILVSDWNRGFPHAVVGTAADWLTHADSILAAHPVQEVTLTGDRESCRYWRIQDAAAIQIYFRGNVRDWTFLRDIEYDLTRRFGPATMWPQNPTHDDTDRAFLSARWPRVKTWHLPPEPMPQGWERFDVDTNQFLQDAYEAGVRSGERQVQALFDAFLGAESPPR